MHDALHSLFLVQIPPDLRIIDLMICYYVDIVLKWPFFT